MFDPASISAALASVKSILDILKNAKDAQLATKIGGEIANLQGRLIEVQQQALDLQTENQELKRGLKALTDIRDNFELRQGVYFRSGTQDAYCPLCMGAKNNIVPLTKDGDGWMCGIHKTHFPGDDEGPGFAFIPGRRY